MHRDHRLAPLAVARQAAHWGFIVPQETELKLRILGLDGAAALQRLRGSPSLRRRRPQTLTLANRYWDTPEHWLLRQGCALRVRSSLAAAADGSASSPRWAQTLKTAGTQQAGLSQRGEWETPIERADIDQAALQDTPLAALDPDGSQRQRLQPVFDTDFQRTLWHVRRRDGTRVEVALDVGHIRAGRRQQPILELELELQQGEPAALLALAQELATRLPLLPCSASKAERGYALARGTPPQPQHAHSPALPPGADPSQLARVVLPEMLDQLFNNLVGLLDHNDPGFVHQARVAWRRWRSATRLLRPWLGEAPNPQALQPLWQTLGALRDHDVAATDTLPRWGTAFVQAADAPAEREQRQAAVAQAVAQLRRASSQLRGHARRQLAQPATGAAWLALLAWVHGLPGSVAAEPDWAMQRLARWHRRWRRLLRAAQAPDAPIERVHEARLRAKRLRYAAEAVASAMRARDARQLRQWQREGSTWQAHIGAMRDLQRCAQLLRKHRGASDLLSFLQGAAHAWPGSVQTAVLA